MIINWDEDNDDNVVIRVGRVFTVPRDKIQPYFKGFRQDEYPTTFPWSSSYNLHGEI